MGPGRTWEDFAGCGGWVDDVKDNDRERRRRGERKCLEEGEMTQRDNDDGMGVVAGREGQWEGLLGVSCGYT